MIPKQFDQIEYDDFLELIESKVVEGKTIEYKREAVTNASSDKDKFLGGISAFANTIGGDFILGIEAVEGIPIKLCGLIYESADSEILRLEQIIQNGLEPRLPSINLKEIQSPNGDKFVLIRVERSWIAPHKVKANDKFYGRNSKGKYPFDVSELRSAFMLSEKLSENIRAFRASRIKKIKDNDEMPVELVEGGKIVVHAIPLSAFSTDSAVDLSNPRQIWGALGPINGDGWSGMINLDGVLSFSRSTQYPNKYEAYTQLFRNGCVEAVGTLTLMDDNLIPSEFYEQRVVTSLKEYLGKLPSLGINAPAYIFLSFVGVKGFSLMVVGSNFNGRSLDRQEILLPSLVVNSFEDFSAENLRSTFDMVWNAFGYERSFNFDENGKWIKG